MSNAKTPEPPEQPEQPSLEQRAYYLWLTLKRVQYVLNTSTAQGMRANISIAYEGNKAQGMPFVEQSRAERLADCFRILGSILR